MANMFCFQCQEAACGKGCTVNGVCGKTADVAKAQDLLVYVTKGLAVVSNEGRQVGLIDNNVDKYITENLFSTITNANFNREALLDRVKETLKLREELKAEVLKVGGQVGEAKKNSGFFSKLFRITSSERVIPEAAIWSPSNMNEFHEQRS